MRLQFLVFAYLFKTTFCFSNSLWTTTIINTKAQPFNSFICFFFVCCCHFFNILFMFEALPQLRNCWDFFQPLILKLPSWLKSDWKHLEFMEAFAPWKWLLDLNLLRKFRNDRMEKKLLEFSLEKMSYKFGCLLLKSTSSGYKSSNSKKCQETSTAANSWRYFSWNFPVLFLLKLQLATKKWSFPAMNIKEQKK